jgi:hypothetical protein
MPHGTTCEEVEQMLDMRHQTASARRTDLRASGYTTYLLDADKIEIRRPTSTGSPARVEVATAKGVAAITYGLPLQLNGHDPTRGYHGDDPASTTAFGRTSRHHDAWRVLECMVKFS